MLGNDSVHRRHDRVVARALARTTLAPSSVGWLLALLVAAALLTTQAAHGWTICPRTATEVAEAAGPVPPPRAEQEASRPEGNITEPGAPRSQRAPRRAPAPRGRVLPNPPEYPPVGRELAAASASPATLPV
jgi:hypothetical protein